jgi:hypothetical protein
MTSPRRAHCYDQALGFKSREDKKREHRGRGGLAPRCSRRASPSLGESSPRCLGSSGRDHFTSADECKASCRCCPSPPSLPISENTKGVAESTPEPIRSRKRPPRSTMRVWPLASSLKTTPRPHGHGSGNARAFQLPPPDLPPSDQDQRTLNGKTCETKDGAPCRRVETLRWHAKNQTYQIDREAQYCSQ